MSVACMLSRYKLLETKEEIGGKFFKATWSKLFEAGGVAILARWMVERARDFDMQRCFLMELGCAV